MHDELLARRHSAAHLMAWAVSNLFPDAKLDIGPATDDGFYYDFDLTHRLVPEDLTRIEEEMRRLAATGVPFVAEEWSRAEAEERLRAAHQPYKLERLADIPAEEKITGYRCGEYTDLPCRGPHVASTSEIGAFKLLTIAGSYFRGDEHNPMLQRIYGTAFATEAELKEYLDRLEEAKKRDHRRLGKDLDLFSLNDEIGGGLVLWHPRGARIRTTIENFWREQHYRNGYELLYTPHLGLGELWETSGHLGFYRENMYAPLTIEGRDFYVKPMNCPFHIKIYQSRPRSYRELPLRWAELGTVYRFEKSGVLHGLLRVRGFTQDDAHIFCRPDQIEDEITEVLRFCRELLNAFGFRDYQAYLATRPAKAVGDPARWEQATRSLENAARRLELKTQVDEGGGAFYGPKIDLKIKDALGREWQCSTIQFDFNMSERFDVSYIGEDGQKHQPYMVHRALFGSLERFFAVLLEHYAGAFPLWLAWEQARVLPVAPRHHPAAVALRDALRGRGLLVEADLGSETLGKRVSNARLERVPYLLVIGDREASSGQASVRSRRDGELGAMTAEAVAARLLDEVSRKA